MHKPTTVLCLISLFAALLPFPGRSHAGPVLDELIADVLVVP